MNLDNYVKAQINRMARQTRTTLTPRHEAVLEFAYRYYEQNKVGPLYNNLKKAVGITKSELESLFPYGLFSVYSWVGIPVPSTANPCKPLVEIKVSDYREVYLDHNATTGIRAEIATLLHDYYQGKWGYANPSSSTVQGKKAFDMIQQARTQVASCLRTNPEEIIFTGSGSEANNLAIKGLALSHLPERGHIVSTRIEHPSVLHTLEYLETLGFTVSYLPVLPDGRVTAGAVDNAIRKDTFLVSVMAVNNEIGTINPLKEIGEVCRRAGIPLMVDAVQAFGKLPLFPKEIGISFLSFSGHKIYAPKGIGGLYIDKKINLCPLVHGGSQEFGLRAGTENVGHILAFGLAAQLANQEREREYARIEKLRDYFLAELQKNESGFILNGSLANRLPHNLNIGFANVDSGSLLLSLNRIGICVSAGSACSAGAGETSYVLQALEVDTDHYGSIRFSFGLNSTEEDLKYLFRYLPELLKKIRETGE